MIYIISYSSIFNFLAIAFLKLSIFELIEDIELIRRKSGISYQEAVALLDYHNGNVARALVDLERNGRLKEEAEPARANSRPASSSTSKSSSNSTSTSLLDKLFRARFKVHRGETTILNISALFALLSLMISGHLVIIGLIIRIALGYKFSTKGALTISVSDIIIPETKQSHLDTAEAKVDKITKQGLGI